MSLINKKTFLILAASCTVFSLAGCAEEKAESNIRLSNLYSEKAAYAQDEEIILNVTANSKTSDYILKSVTIKYYLDYTRQTTNAFSVQPLNEVSTITNYVIATNAIKKNEQAAQKFEITKFTYSFNSQIYEQDASLSYTVAKKSAVDTENLVTVDGIDFKSSSTNFVPDYISEDGLEKHYSVKRSILASPTALLQVELPCSYDPDRVKDLYWMIRCTMEDGTVGEFTVARNNLNLIEDGEWIISTTRKIEVYGAMFRLNDEVQTRTNLFDIVPTVNIEAIASDVVVSAATIRTETTLSSQVSGIYYANKTDRIQLTVDVLCGSEHEITGIYFTYEKGGNENRVAASLKNITYTPVPGKTGVLTASVSANINFGSSGTYNFKKFEALYKIKDSSNAETLEADALKKELKLNVLDGLIQNATEFVDAIKENPSGYFALTSNFEISSSFADMANYIVENFAGTIDGNGYKISISYARSCWFKKITGTIKNLTIYTPSLRITQDLKTTCILAETNEGLITDVTIDGIELYIDQNGAGFKGIVAVNNGTLSNIELLYKSASYKTTSSWSTTFTGLCEVNNGRIVGVVASYADGFEWNDDLPSEYDAVRRWAKTLNCVVKTNNATGQFDNGVDKGMMDVILYFQFHAVRNSFHKINLFYAEGNGNVARLFYWKEGIHSALSSMYLNITKLTSGFDGTTVSTINSAIERLTAGTYMNESNGKYYGVHFDRPYILGFDNSALYGNETWRDNDGILHNKKATHFTHLMYAECFRNVGYIETNYYALEDNPGAIITESNTLKVFDGTINSGTFVAYNELYTNEFLFGKTKGTFLSTQSWNSNIKLIHSKSFVVFYGN